MEIYEPVSALYDPEVNYMIRLSKNLCSKGSFISKSYPGTIALKIRRDKLK